MQCKMCGVERIYREKKEICDDCFGKVAPSRVDRSEWVRPRRTKHPRRRFARWEWVVLDMMRPTGSDVDGILFRIGVLHPEVSISHEQCRRASRSFASSGYVHLLRMTTGDVFYCRTAFGDAALRWAKWLGVIRKPWTGPVARPRDGQARFIEVDSEEKLMDLVEFPGEG